MNKAKWSEKEAVIEKKQIPELSGLWDIKLDKKEQLKKNTYIHIKKKHQNKFKI